MVESSVQKEASQSTNPALELTFSNSSVTKTKQFQEPFNTIPERQGLLKQIQQTLTDLNKKQQEGRNKVFDFESSISSLQIKKEKLKNMKNSVQTQQGQYKQKTQNEIDQLQLHINSLEKNMPQIIGNLKKIKQGLQLQEKAIFTADQLSKSLIKSIETIPQKQENDLRKNQQEQRTKEIENSIKQKEYLDQTLNEMNIYQRNNLFSKVTISEKSGINPQNLEEKKVEDKVQDKVQEKKEQVDKKVVDKVQEQIDSKLEEKSLGGLSEFTGKNTQKREARLQDILKQKQIDPLTQLALKYMLRKTPKKEGKLDILEIINRGDYQEITQFASPYVQQALQEIQDIRDAVDQLKESRRRILRGQVKFKEERQSLGGKFK